jgi:hypothetical protein
MELLILGDGTLDTQLPCRQAVCHTFKLPFAWFLFNLETNTLAECKDSMLRTTGNDLKSLPSISHPHNLLL